MMKLYTIILTVTAFLTGCATMRDSLLLGGAMGATAGGVVGNASGQDAKSTAIGAVIGAATGTLFGYLGHKEEKRKEQDRQAQLNALKGGKPKYPSVSTPEVRAVWVPDKIENDQFISGHFIYVIDKPATFRQE